MPKTAKAAAGAKTTPRHVPGKGLKVERVFTKPGVHPYDEVEWESRDVVMTNWRDGSINFEQRGVEFPSFWSINATQIVTSKYFRGAVGTPQRETGLKQVIDRVVTEYHRAGEKNGYFATAEDSQVFADELTWLLLHQYFSFNSPVWFNVGTQAPQQVSACFILSVDDTMESILDWYKEEGMIFKGGSGAGVNLSKIRASAELLSSGGNASGPISFMRGADASAGTIKSGGATRRAAKMVVLDVEHPDIEAFIDTKAREEDKIRALRDAGFDVDLGGEDMFSVQYQNANNSVRVSDTFMKAVEEGTDYALTGRLDGKEIGRRDAREVFRKMATAAWECADPGIQYDDVINDWHTNPNTDRIYASNPCFPADERVVTDKGLIKIGDLVRRSAEGETFAVFTNDVTAETDAAERVVATSPTRYMVTGTNEIMELRFSDGSRLRCTPGHRLWTANRGWVHAEELQPDDKVVRSDQYAARSAATTRIPRAALAAAESTGSALRLPHKWDDEPELAHFMGWLVGDGCVTDESVVAVYGTEAEQREALPRHQKLLERLTGRLGKPSVQSNGTVQLRAGHAGLREFFKALGFSTGRAADKVLPEALYEADEHTLVDFLKGLFDADGCVVEQSNGTRYVGLAGKSEELLLGVQETLGALGIGARIYRTESKDAKFAYTKKDGTEVVYESEGPFFDLRITGPSMVEFAALIGFGLESKSAKLQSVLDFKSRYDTDRTVRLTRRESVGFETTYNLTEPRNHSYIVGGVVVANCSEYMSLNDSSCNLASLNLMKFLGADGSFDVDRFVKTVEFVITAMEISISFADFPTEKIGQTTRDYRQLGIGYSNLGALLMASGHAYDSDEGRSLAAAITALMTGVSYRRSAEIAGVVGPYAGYEINAEPHQRVMRKHAEAARAVRTYGDVDATVLDAAKSEWDDGNAIGAQNGWRNAQASVLAPTGCLTGDTLITTDRGLTRLASLGDPFGDKWQDLDATVSTDEGPQQATKFFVNGEEPTRKIITEAGYRIQGTLVHRIKVIDEATGQWEWKRLAEVQPGDLVPMQLRQLVGEPNHVPLPVLDQAYYTEDGELTVPDSVSEELAELVGYFMGDGSLHAKGIRLCVAEDDQDVTDHLCRLSEKLFNLTPQLTQREGYIEVMLQSVRLARWWRAAGFAKGRPSEDHSGKGWTPRVPAAILETNAESVYEAFIRGLFEADGTVQEGVQSVSTCTPEFADEIRTLLLVIGFASTTRTTATGWGGDASVVRIRNLDHALNFAERIGFIGGRKTELQAWEEPERSAKRDRVHLPRATWEEIVPVGHPYRNRVVNALRKNGGVPRQTATDLYAHTRDERLRFAIGYLFERVEANEDGGVVPTYDLSVPANVTYVANGMVSHNTISFMMDCDTTGIEPDLALVKFKKMVGGGSMEIVNQTVPRALTCLGYDADERDAIVAYIAEHGHVIGAPALKEEHYSVFDCAMGERSISPMGHVNMMAAVQPFLSGSTSKTVNLPESATVEDIEEVYFQGWKLGIKALAVYRDNCKVGQPLSAKKKEIDKAVEDAVEQVVETVAAHAPVRRKLPKKRPSQTISFTVGGAEGYMTSSSYPDDGLGEVFLKMSKQGSTLAGVMDALSVSISIALQYGVPLEKYVEKFTNMRFEPAGMTDDPDIRMASSLVDYIFRRLALDYLPYEDRAAIGILTTAERTAELNGEDPSKVSQPEVDLDALRASAPIEEAVGERVQIEAKPKRLDVLNSAQARSADAPLCMNCGTKMRPAGSCYACEGCGATSGCS